MSEAGQIFALLRSSSAAELAKRFANWGDGTGPGQGGPTGAGDVEPTPGPNTGTPAGKGASAPAPLAPGAMALPGAMGEGRDAAPGDQTLQPQTGLLRATVSLGHLAPARADLARHLADSLLSGLPRTGGNAAGAGFTLGASLGLAGFAATSATDDPQAAPTAARAWAAIGDADSATGRAGPAAAGADRTAAGASGVLRGADLTARSGATSASTGLDLAKPGDAQGQAAASDQAQTGTETRGSATGKAGVITAAQAAVFAEAMTALLGPLDTGRGASVASGVIFNAAMIPGWPFPSAMARDGATGINPKAMLHQLASAIEGMTPQQAAEYMAKIGAGHVLLRKLRQILKELDLTDKDEVKGLLFAFLETISTIAAGLQTALRQISESASLQAAVVHGEDPDDNDRPGRRRLKL